MKKVLFTLICVIAGTIYFFTHSPDAPRPEERGTKIKEHSPGEEARRRIQPVKQSPPARVPAEIPAVMPEDSAPQSMEIKPPANRTITHSVADFKAWGQFENTVADGHLRLADDATEAASPTGYAISGLYTSIQDLAGLFDQITFQCEGVVPEGGVMIFEFRTSNADGQWSDWQPSRIKQLGQPIKLTAPATGWQYRLGLHASAPANSPEISKVTIATENTVTTTLSPN